MIDPDRHLWQSVLLRQILDALPKSELKSTKHDQRCALAWIGDWPSKDFCEVCEWAGVEPSKAHKKIKAWISSPKDERLEIAKILRAQETRNIFRAGKP